MNTARCGEEEVKYVTNEKGFIVEISKQVNKPEGEELGINCIEGRYLATYEECLAEVGAQDYFEKGMERLIEREGNVFKPQPVGDELCIEVDFEADLARAVDALK